MASPSLKGRVLITGGAGFLGRTIMRRAERDNWPVEFTIFSRDETIQEVCRHRYGNAQYILGDVRDTDRLTDVMAGHSTVIHAAAAKYVPEGEYHPNEFVDININGARAVIRAAIRAGVTQVIGISTDKACLPLNTYGMTKAVMERLFAEADTWAQTRFVCTRYGNVVGSTGSVIPLFLKQARGDGVLQLTDPEMTRFWLSPDEAVDLIVQTLHTVGPALIVPKASAMRMSALAGTLAERHNARVQTIGVRPGEKKHETLLSAQESIHTIEGEDHFAVLRMTEVEARASRSFEYSSDKPQDWVKPDDMLAMIEDAALI